MFRITDPTLRGQRRDCHDPVELLRSIERLHFHRDVLIRGNLAPDSVLSRLSSSKILPCFFRFFFSFLSLCDEDTTIDGILKRREEGIISNFELVYSKNGYVERKEKKRHGGIE